MGMGCVRRLFVIGIEMLLVRIVYDSKEEVQIYETHRFYRPQIK